jgi:hypothetical protein
MSFPKKDRGFRSTGGAGGSGPHAAEFAHAVAEALRSEYEGNSSAVKRVALLTGANERTVKNWFDASNAPSGHHLVMLARHSNQVLGVFLILAGRTDSLVPLQVATARAALVRALGALDGLAG